MDPLGRSRLRHGRLLVRRQPHTACGTRGLSKVRLKGNIDWTFGGSGHRDIWMHRNGFIFCSSAPPVLFFGTARESDQGDAGVQSIGCAVVDVAPSDHFELIARQTSGSTKNVAADEFSWFAIEVVE
jgi:hypothetical protein